MSDTSSLESFIRELNATEDLSVVWRICVQFFRERGARMISYHAPRSLAAFEEATPASGIVSTGFPADWVCEYIEDRLFLVDPIPDIAQQLQMPVFWSQAWEKAPLSEANRDYLRRLRHRGLGEGLAIPVFGPAFRNGYVGLGFGGERPAMTATGLMELQAAAQMAHNAYCRLVQTRAGADTELSPRERQVLQWIAHGKSKSVIAEILTISPHTVDSLTRRIFDKLGVSDRTSAAILGIGSGVIQM